MSFETPVPTVDNPETLQAENANQPKKEKEKFKEFPLSLFTKIVHQKLQPSDAYLIKAFLEQNGVETTQGDIIRFIEANSENAEPETNS